MSSRVGCLGIKMGWEGLGWFNVLSLADGMMQIVVIGIATLNYLLTNKLGETDTKDYTKVVPSNFYHGANREAKG